MVYKRHMYKVSQLKGQESNILHVNANVSNVMYAVIIVCQVKSSRLYL